MDVCHIPKFAFDLFLTGISQVGISEKNCEREDKLFSDEHLEEKLNENKAKQNNIKGLTV